MTKRKSTKKIGLQQVLVLNKYMLHLFGVDSLEVLAEKLHDSANEGYGADNISKFYHALVQGMFTNRELDKDTLLQYDQNIFRHSQKISEKREQPIRWKYFQYLALLFTEIYLDKYFRDKAGFLAELNAFVDKFNDPFYGFAKFYNPAGWEMTHFEETDLRKLSFWNATGSGKTLLMHINIEQYLHYLQQYRQGATLNKILLITPNEGLSMQHLQEFRESSLEANIFDKKRQRARGLGNLFAGKSIEIIEIHKLEDKEGDKTVAVDSFEENNLVLIDEGHRGSSGTEWKRRRDQLSGAGFSFEYSATFGQAVAAAGSKKTALLKEYAKSTLFDYSYKYFHGDGYGKDFEILNLDDTTVDTAMQKYLVACLLTFYQQQLVFAENKRLLRDWLIEKPLCIFVGGSVTKSFNKKEASDIQTIVEFIGRFVHEKKESMELMEQLMSGQDGLEDKNYQSVFGNKFGYLYQRNMPASQIYEEILRLIFNANLDGGRLHLVNLKGKSGEIGLRIGQSDYFGVINVSDDAKLLKQLAAKGFSTSTDEFAKSIFSQLNSTESKANLLIGAKKFTEGWSSWRVSMMGLMNIGRSEGSQIIQLFGRGVRLRGYRFSLKRSNRLDQNERPEKIPSFLPYLETLNVFGIRSDYMAHFKQFLEEEGLGEEAKEVITIRAEHMPTVELDKKKLKLVRVQEGRNFKKEQKRVELLPPKESRVAVVLDWYPKISILKSKAKKEELGKGVPEEGKLSGKHLAFMDWNAIYFALQQFKNERNWYNLSFSQAALEELLRDATWYTLYIPESELKFIDFNQVWMWQEIAISLLKLYFDRSYKYLQQKYYSQYLETFVVDGSHPNLMEVEEYVFEVSKSQQRIIAQLRNIKEAFVQNDGFKEQNFGSNSGVFVFKKHLFQPLVWFSKKENKQLISVKPVELNMGEKRFVKDLEAFCKQNENFFADKEIFLLRNISKKGVGFFEANNFYPDFILWILHQGKQYISFIDPKGLRNVSGFTDAKVEFYKNVKEKIQDRLDDKSVVLNSFIVSNTPFHKVPWRENRSIREFNEHNIYFQDVGVQEAETYITQILEKVLE